MVIETRTEVYYYCTVCDKEYAKEDKDDGLVCIECSSCLEKVEGCKDCMRQCLEPHPEKLRSHMKGCGRWFCKNCVKHTKLFASWYPYTLCKKCVSKYGLEKFYPGDELWKEIEQWRIGEFGKFPMKAVLVDGEKKLMVTMNKAEVDQRIFQRYYVSPRHKKVIKDGWTMGTL